MVADRRRRTRFFGGGCAVSNGVGIEVVPESADVAVKQDACLAGKTNCRQSECEVVYEFDERASRGWVVG
jgi:hypothetical protein